MLGVRFYKAERLDDQFLYSDASRRCLSEQLAFLILTELGGCGIRYLLECSIE